MTEIRKGRGKKVRIVWDPEKKKEVEDYARAVGLEVGEFIKKVMGHVIERETARRPI
jgi:hypothetical protein